MLLNTNIDKKEMKAMLTVFRILFGKNAKVGNRLAYKPQKNTCDLKHKQILDINVLKLTSLYKERNNSRFLAFS
jgi:hypothetical protein